MSGPLTGLAHPVEVKGFYEAIARVCAAAEINVYLPHRLSDPAGNPSLTPVEVYAADRSRVVESDLVIAYVGLPSLGVGSEIEIAREHNIPVLLMAEEGAQVSRMARGNPAVVAELRFIDFADGLERLAFWLQSQEASGWAICTGVLGKV